MVQVPINYLAVIVAAIANMVIGFLWYGPIFGKMWIEMMGITKEQIETAKKEGMNKTYAIAFVGSLLMAYVLAHTLVFASSYMQVYGVPAGLSAGFWNWLGFVVPVLLGTVLWEGRSWRLWGLNAGYYLVSILVMGIILSIWI